MKLVYILVLLIFIKCILLYKLYHSLPVVELKRRARNKNKRAEALYKVANNEAGLDILLWAVGTTAAVTLFIWSARTAWWLAAAVILVSALLAIWLPALLI